MHNNTITEARNDAQIDIEALFADIPEFGDQGLEQRQLMELEERNEIDAEEEEARKWEAFIDELFAPKLAA
jgi:hypothetical protein